ncbi:MAG TPA: hypothetical protein VF547_01700 [Allosphingosinicella sp.]|jgi:predicted nucleic acid-binding protein
MEVDPDVVRRGEAESDVVVAELSGKPVTIDAAARERAKQSVSGTISVTLHADAAGNVTKRTKTVVLKVRKPDGPLEKRTATETVERRFVSGRGGGR